MAVEDRRDVHGNRVIDEYNFFVDTECTWCELGLEGYEHVTSRYPSYTSPHGSSTYWYDVDGVYRLSDHWGANVRSCNWFLDSFPEDEEARKDSLVFYYEYKGAEHLAFARWEDFRDIAGE